MNKFMVEFTCHSGARVAISGARNLDGAPLTVRFTIDDRTAVFSPTDALRIADALRATVHVPRLTAHLDHAWLDVHS